MSISQVQTATAGTAQALGSGRQPGREDFLNLLVTQLQHQDPLQPMEGTEFVTQLAQFSGIEQLVQINERLGLLEIGQASAANSQATALVGKPVTVRADTIHVAEEGRPTICFDLDGAAESVTVTLADAAGRVVGSREAGPRGPGFQKLGWPEELPPGTYQVRVEARGSSGDPVQARNLVSGTVTEVRFEHGYPELLIDDIRVRLADLISVGTQDPEGP